MHMPLIQPFLMFFFFNFKQSRSSSYSRSCILQGGVESDPTSSQQFSRLANDSNKSYLFIYDRCDRRNFQPFHHSFMDSTKPEWANTPINKQTCNAGAYYSLCILGEQKNPWVQNWFLNSYMINGVADVSDQTFFLHYNCL